MSSVNWCTHSTDSSRTFHTSASPPPGRSTRWISASAGSASNQWNAWAAVTTSIERSASGMASAVPSRISASGHTTASLRRMAWTGSTATTVAPLLSSPRVNLPVPAARSQAWVRGRSGSSSVSRSNTAWG